MGVGQDVIDDVGIRVLAPQPVARPLEASAQVGKRRTVSPSSRRRACWLGSRAGKIATTPASAKPPATRLATVRLVTVSSLWGLAIVLPGSAWR